MAKSKFFAVDGALVEAGASVGSNTKIWHSCHVRKGSKIGKDCILGRGVFVDAGVKVADKVKIQNYACLFSGVQIEKGVFIGPHVCFTNDYIPRAVTPNFKLKSATDWKVVKTVVKEGASIGANATIVAGVQIGKWSLIGAGSVVTKDIPPYALAVGNPAKVKGVVSPSGEILSKSYKPGVYRSSKTKEVVKILPAWVA